MRSYNYGVAEAEVDLGGIVGAVAARARTMTPESDPGGFLQGLSAQLQGLIPHDRVTVLYLDEGGRTFSVFAEHAAGGAPPADGRYTLSLARASRYPTAEAVSSLVFPGQAGFVRAAQSDARGMAGTAAPGAREPVLMRDCESELDLAHPADRTILEDGIRSFVAVPLIFADKVGALLAFAKRQPDGFDKSDLEVVEEIAQHVVVAIQHQRLAEEQRRLAMAEGRAQQLERRVQRLHGALSEPYGFGRILGQAPSLREALERAARVAPQETPVLLTGESGTGKELVAQAIHYASRRADGPCVAINCAALPDTLIESELFGHERGAFTGADRRKPGRFEVAAGGTLFLHEVGELAASVQAKLLRVLQEHEFQRVGGTATLKADFRLIVATNRNLTDAMARGQFREDLYYRLSVFPIHLPPLRERGEDVVLLAQEFVRRLGERMGKGETGLSRDAPELLVTYPWPGNIRALQNPIERALIVSDAGLITAAQLGLTLPRLPPAEASLPAVSTPSRVANQDAAAATLQKLERHAIADALAKTKRNKTAAAAALGITRMQLYTKLKRFGSS